MKARSHSNKGQVADAQKLYQAILQAFPNNKRAQQVLANLNKLKPQNTLQIPSQETIDQLINIYNQGQLSLVITQAKKLLESYPDSFIIWNVLGTSAAQTGMLDLAIDKAFSLLE